MELEEENLNSIVEQDPSEPISLEEGYKYLEYLQTEQNPNKLKNLRIFAEDAAVQSAVNVDLILTPPPTNCPPIDHQSAVDTENIQKPKEILVSLLIFLGISLAAYFFITNWDSIIALLFNLDQDAIALILTEHTR